LRILSIDGTRCFDGVLYPEMFSRKKLYTQPSNEDDALVDDALIDVVKVSDT